MFYFSFKLGFLNWMKNLFLFYFIIWWGNRHKVFRLIWPSAGGSNGRGTGMWVLFAAVGAQQIVDSQWIFLTWLGLATSLTAVIGPLKWLPSALALSGTVWGQDVGQTEHSGQWCDLTSTSLTQWNRSVRGIWEGWSETAIWVRTFQLPKLFLFPPTCSQRPAHPRAPWVCLREETSGMHLTQITVLLT